MRVARSSQTRDDRRRVVIDLLQFIHDFNQLDTSLLVGKADADFAFVEAAEAVLQSAIGPWNSVEALRNFCVQALGGEKPLRDMDRVRPRSRVTPFSVPYDLLRAVVPHRGQFDPARLRSLGKTLEKELPAGHTDIGNLVVPQDQWWLVTTVWARPVPRHPPYRYVTLRIADEGSGRVLYDGALQTLYEEPMPCWWPLPPNSYLRTSVHGYVDEDYAETMLLLAFEGWVYHWS